MKLRARLILAMLACALLPTAAAGLLTRPALIRYVERSEARRRDAAVSRVERAIDARAGRLSASLARFCEHDPLVERALALLEARQWTAASRDEIAPRTLQARNALGLDTLSLVREGGEVLGNAQDPPRAWLRDEATWRLAARAPGREPAHGVRAARVRDAGGATRDLLVLEALCVARRGASAVAVAGGEAVDRGLAQEVGEGGTTVTVAPGPAAPAGAAAPGGFSRVLLLRGVDGTVAASVVVTSSGEPLRAALADLNNLMLLAAVFAASTAVFLALVLTPRVVRPITKVADAADKIARGDRTVRIDDRSVGETGRLVNAFNQMTEVLDAAEKRVRRAERIAAWRDIARQMAHEIKNPLTPIQMAVEMLRKARERNLPEFDQLFEEETRIVLEEVARLRRLVENFSRFARAPRPKPGPMNVTEVVSHVVVLHAGGVAEVTGEADPKLPIIRADREQLTQVLVNLVANACHAAEDRARAAPQKGVAAVHVTASDLRDGRVSVAVDDNGAGIPEEVLARLFQPYVTTKEGGTGLGLAIAYRIVHEHGGTLTADTSPEGTRFEIILPVTGPALGDSTMDTLDVTRR